MKILITGGAGFIGSALVRFLLDFTQHHILVIDKLTYAANINTITAFGQLQRFEFIKLDICDFTQLCSILDAYQPDLVFHLAAETHVDRSIQNADNFIQSNIVGTYNMLEALRKYWLKLEHNKKELFRFLHISTDEVYGDLGLSDSSFTENSPYAPSSPYSASKAASDHLVRAWHRTYDLPVLITNCSNNYGPYQHPEKLIPLVITNALQGKVIPVYGDGLQIRDWLYVDDHVRALYLVATKGIIGETYNIGGNQQKQNIDVINTICSIMDKVRPDSIDSYKRLINHVADRAGHDIKYAIDSSKITHQLGWKPVETFDSGLNKTIIWFLDHESWWKLI